MEARYLGQVPGDGDGFRPDIAPGAGKPVPIGEMAIEIENRRRIDPAVINHSDEVGGAIIEFGQASPLRLSRLCLPPMSTRNALIRRCKLHGLSVLPTMPWTESRRGVHEGSPESPGASVARCALI